MFQVCLWCVKNFQVDLLPENDGKEDVGTKKSGENRGKKSKALAMNLFSIISASSSSATGEEELQTQLGVVDMMKLKHDLLH